MHSIHFPGLGLKLSKVFGGFGMFWGLVLIARWGLGSGVS